MDSNYQSQNPSGNPYDFILNPEKPKKMGKFRPGGNNNLFKTVAIILGSTFILMLIATVALNFFAPKTLKKEDVIGLAQTQQELIRVTNEASGSAVQQATQNLAATVQYTITTQQQATLKLLAAKGVNVDKKQLELKQNADTDQKLTTATSTSTFDTVFTQIMENQLNSYASNLKQLYEQAAAGKTESELFAKQHTEVQLLISQIPYTQEDINGSAP